MTNDTEDGYSKSDRTFVATWRITTTTTTITTSTTTTTIIIIFINCNWVVTRWQWLFYM